jgi:hypothetical protein
MKKRMKRAREEDILMYFHAKYSLYALVIG